MPESLSEGSTVVEEVNKSSSGMLLLIVEVLLPICELESTFSEASETVVPWVVELSVSRFEGFFSAVSSSTVTLSSIVSDAVVTSSKPILEISAVAAVVVILSSSSVPVVKLVVVVVDEGDSNEEGLGDNELSSSSFELLGPVFGPICSGATI